MLDTYQEWKANVDAVPLEGIQTNKPAALTTVQVVFDKLNQSIAQLPPPQREQVLIAFTTELRKMGVAFIAGVNTLKKELAGNAGDSEAPGSNGGNCRFPTAI